MGVGCELESRIAQLRAELRTAVLYSNWPRKRLPKASFCSRMPTKLCLWTQRRSKLWQSSGETQMPLSPCEWLGCSDHSILSNSCTPACRQGNYQGTAPFLITPLDGFANFSRTIYSDGNDVSPEASHSPPLAITVVLDPGGHPRR